MGDAFAEDRRAKDHAARCKSSVRMLEDNALARHIARQAMRQVSDANPSEVIGNPENPEIVQCKYEG